jgi:hypothetical protein
MEIYVPFVDQTDARDGSADKLVTNPSFSMGRKHPVQCFSERRGV